MIINYKKNRTQSFELASSGTLKSSSSVLLPNITPGVFDLSTPDISKILEIGIGEGTPQIPECSLIKIPFYL